MDLLDLLAQSDGTADLVHVLMPCMAYACGEDIVTVGGHFQVGIVSWRKVTCRACRAFDPEDLRATMRIQQGNQAGMQG